LTKYGSKLQKTCIHRFTPSALFSLRKKQALMPTTLRQFGIIGHPLGHTFSPGYFAAKFEREGITGCRYDAYPLPRLAGFAKWVRSIPNLAGLNVTIPYKSAIIPLLDGLSEEAADIGAVNVIRIAEGKLTGYNSDVYGFAMSLSRFLPTAKPSGQQALVLGTGGSSRAVQFALRQMGVPFRLVSRSPQAGCLVYEEIGEAEMAAHPLIVNTTPVGMSPDVGACPPLPYQFATPGHYFFDLVYNPAQTRFLAEAAARGAHTRNGLEMLHLQAERAWQIWNM
jgi:shikimate dehydrogenase